MTLGAALLAGDGLRVIRQEGRYRRLFLRTGVVILGASLLATLVIFVRRMVIDRWANEVSKNWGAFVPPDAPVLSQFLLVSSRTAVVPLALGLGVVALGRIKRLRIPALPWFTILLVFDLLVGASYSVRTGPRMLREGGESMFSSTLKRDPDSTLCHTYDVLALQLAIPGEENREWSQAIMARLLSCPNVGVCDGLRLGTPYSAVLTPARSSLREWLDEGKQAATLALGCTHLISTRFFPHAWFKELPLPMPKNAPDLYGAIHYYRVVEPLPKVFHSVSPFFFSSTESTLRALSVAKSWQNVSQVIDDPLHRIQGSPLLPAGGGITGEKAAWENPSRIVLTPEGSGAAVFGVRTDYAVGWGATQAGQAIPVVRVGGVQLGAWVEDVAKGPVLFEYHAPTFLLSLWISLFGILLAALLLWKCVR